MHPSSIEQGFGKRWLIRRPLLSMLSCESVEVRQVITVCFLLSDNHAVYDQSHFCRGIDSEEVRLSDIRFTTIAMMHQKISVSVKFSSPPFLIIRPRNFTSLSLILNIRIHFVPILLKISLVAYSLYPQNSQYPSAEPRFDYLQVSLHPFGNCPAFAAI